MNDEQVKKRMEELMRPIDERIMMCDSTEDVLMLASIMMTTAVNIFKLYIGEKAVREMVSELLDG